MKTVYGKLAALFFVLMGALLLFLPMRSGMEDYLYAYPHSIRMNKGDTYAITYVLDSDHAQRVSYAAVDESVCRVSAQGVVTAVNGGSTDIRLNAEGGARTTVHVEVAGTGVTQLTLNADSIAMEKGQVTGLRAIFNEGAEDTRIEWRSMDDAIAEVDSVGRVTARRGGQTIVYAVTPSGVTAGASVFVHVSGDAVRITPEELTVGTGATLAMGTYYLPDDATDEVAYWRSNDSRVLTVDPSGEIRAVGVGQAVLSVFTKEGLSASTVVNVERAAASFDLSPSAVTLERGNTLELDARFLKADGEIDRSAQEHYIEWQSSDPSVASVENGHVVALATGEAQISASADGMTATCDVRVQVLVHEITFEESEVYLLREQTVQPIQLNPALIPSDPDDPTIVYSTNNDMVAVVDQNGLVTMTGGYGTAIITARASSGAEARFTVNVVTELPDPNAPRPTPTAVPTEAPDDGEPTAAPAGDTFSFDDIGKSVEGRVSVDEIDEADGQPASSGASEAAPSAPSGGASSGGGAFSFDDIGNGVEASKSLDDVEW